MPKLANGMVAWVTFAAAAAADWGPPQRLPDTVNSPYKDCGVCATADGNTIYFASNRANPGRLECDIYRSSRAGSSWSAAELVPGPINTEAEEGSPCLTADDKRMYFHRGRLGTPNGDIYASDWTGSGWGEPYKVPGLVNRDDKWETNPGVTTDGATLYFVGECWPGNLAQVSNIWRSHWAGSAWGEPELVPGINTTRGEGDPDPTYDGQYLYFWSKRDNAFWLYRAEDVGGGWANVVRLDSSINGQYDICADPFVTQDGRYLFFSRTVIGQSNIYDLFVSAWSDPVVEPASLGKIKVLFR